MRAVGCLIAVLLLTSLAVGAARPQDNMVQAQLVADVAAIAPGQEFTVGVLFRITPSWHIYWRNPGESGLATTVQFTLPKGFTVGPVLYPVPQRFEQPGDVVGYGYTGSVMLLAKVKAPKDLAADTKVTMGAAASWLACQDRCIPGQAKLEMSLPIAKAAEPANQELFATWSARVPAPAVSEAEVTTKGSIPPTVSAGAFSITVRWTRTPDQVQWFADAPDALQVTNMVMQTQGDQTRISFRAQILPGQKLDSPWLPSVLAYTDASGDWRGLEIPVQLRPEEKRPTTTASTRPASTRPARPTTRTVKHKPATLPATTRAAAPTTSTTKE